MARVLVVDDSLMIRTLLRDILAAGGHEVVGDAPDGVVAEQRVRSLRPDVVVLDLVMPVRTGLATLPTLLAIDPALIVVICSALADQSRVLRAIRLGAAGFIVKPFCPETVLAGVNEALARGEAGLPRRTPAPAPPAGQPPHPSRRRFPRASGSLPIRVTPAEGPPTITTTIDVGGGGVLLNPIRLTPRERVGFRLELDARQAIEGRATVARIDGAGRPALEFDPVPPDDQARLLALVESLRQEQPALV